MKYIILLGDGMADYADAAGQTPLTLAATPHMDELAQRGMCGLVRTIPEGMPPGSDTANLSVMGYDPRRYYSGRSPLEAVSMGIELAEDDVTYRCNLVCLSDEPRYEDKTMIDYASGEISTAEAGELIRALQAEFNCEQLELHQGISYRHCLVLHHEQTGAQLTPPHDITGRPIRDRLPQGHNAALFERMMRRSYDILQAHPVNQRRIAAGRRPANSMWFWGEGTSPKLDSFQSLYGVRGGVICAVDLIRGIGRCAGMRYLPVAGATGGMVTDYAGKAAAALQLLAEDCDLVYIHVEAPDECGHQGDKEAKIRAISALDQEMLGPMLAEMRRRGEPFAVLLTPDHPTPLAVRTHVSDPVPFVIYRSDRELTPHAAAYSEAAAAATGLFLPAGPLLMQTLLQN